MMPPNVNYLHAAVLIRQWVSCGVKAAVISPGARSTPLAATAARHPDLARFVLVDERSAAFFALGLAKAHGTPTLLICTSGTAAANYYPAVIEAAQSHVPLIVMTADRPISQRGAGAHQTMDQVRLYGNYARFFADVPEARLDLSHLRSLRRLATQAFQAAMFCPSGPVHVNVPLDEPLAPSVEEEHAVAALWKEIEAEEMIRCWTRAESRPSADAMRAVVEQVRGALCGMIIAGPSGLPDAVDGAAILAIGKHLGWPIFADIASGIRFAGDPVIPFYDVLLREPSLASLAPDVVLAFGAHPTSRALNDYLDRHRDATTIRVQPHTHGRDPNARARLVVGGDVAPFAHDLTTSVTAARDSLLYAPFRQASLQIRSHLRQSDRAVPCEASFLVEAVAALPDHANLALANSLPVRYADAMCATEGLARSVFAMRGVSGIDGTISHAAGVADGSGRPTLLVLGDLAFLHDVGGLAAVAKYSPNLALLLLNNNGGGIFHFLPVHEHEPPELFELIHGTPHSFSLRPAGELFGIEWHIARNPSDVSKILADATAFTRPRIIEVQLNRDENHQRYRALLSDLQNASVS